MKSQKEITIELKRKLQLAKKEIVRLNHIIEWNAGSHIRQMRSLEQRLRKDLA